MLILASCHSIVVSIAAILILSIIGGLFRSEHHSMVGSTKDPEDGKAVAGSVFAAVIVYAVRSYNRLFPFASGGWVKRLGMKALSRRHHAHGGSHWII